MLFGQTEGTGQTFHSIYGVKWPRDPISNVRKETERPRSSRSLFHSYISFTACFVVARLCFARGLLHVVYPSWLYKQ